MFPHPPDWGLNIRPEGLLGKPRPVLLGFGAPEPKVTLSYESWVPQPQICIAPSPKGLVLLMHVTPLK